MDLPDEIKIQGILIQGGAFKAKLDRDNYSRFYFVLNRNPQDDMLIILSTSTTHHELHRSCRGGDDVHIVLSPEDYAPFTDNCLICCDRPVKYNKMKLVNILQSGRFDLLPPLPQNIIDRINKGIAKSPVVPPAIKKLILGPEE